MHCQRCNNLMFPLDLLDEGGGLTSNMAPAWRCFACGDIVDPLIFLNRGHNQRHLRQQHKRSPRLAVAVGLGR